MTQIVIAPARLHAFMRLYEVRPRKDKRGVDLISNALPFGVVALHRIQFLIVEWQMIRT